MNTYQPDLQTLLFFAGLSQIALSIGSLAIPNVLNWKREFLKINPLIKQMFWTYAAYILFINLSFGLLSVFVYGHLTDGSVLACAISGFIAIYWISRVAIQFCYFDRKSMPTGWINRFLEGILVALFLFLSIVYVVTFYVNFQEL